LPPSFQFYCLPWPVVIEDRRHGNRNANPTEDARRLSAGSCSASQTEPQCPVRASTFRLCRPETFPHGPPLQHDGVLSTSVRISVPSDGKESCSDSACRRCSREIALSTKDRTADAAMTPCSLILERAVLALPHRHPNLAKFVKCMQTALRTTISTSPNWPSELPRGLPSLLAWLREPAKPNGQRAIGNPRRSAARNIGATRRDINNACRVASPYRPIEKPDQVPNRTALRKLRARPINTALQLSTMLRFVRLDPTRRFAPTPTKAGRNK